MIFAHVSKSWDDPTKSGIKFGHDLNHLDGHNFHPGIIQKTRVGVLRTPETMGRRWLYLFFTCFYRDMCLLWLFWKKRTTSPEQLLVFLFVETKEFKRFFCESLWGCLIKREVPETLNNQFKMDVWLFPTISSWWFQPIWKILVKFDHLPRDRGENKPARFPSNKPQQQTSLKWRKMVMSNHFQLVEIWWIILLKSKRL